jgi:hypothetical protein
MILHFFLFSEYFTKFKLRFFTEFLTFHFFKIVFVFQNTDLEIMDNYCFRSVSIYVMQITLRFVVFWGEEGVDLTLEQSCD